METLDSVCKPSNTVAHDRTRWGLKYQPELYRKNRRYVREYTTISEWQKTITFSIPRNPFPVPIIRGKHAASGVIDCNPCMLDPVRGSRSRKWAIENHRHWDWWAAWKEWNSMNWLELPERERTRVRDKLWRKIKWLSYLRPCGRWDIRTLDK